MTTLVLLPDENFPGPIWRDLQRNHGWPIDETGRYAIVGRPDGDVLRLAVERNGVLLTNDAKFFKQPGVPEKIPDCQGIIFLGARAMEKQYRLEVAAWIDHALRENGATLRGQVLRILGDYNWKWSAP